MSEIAKEILRDGGNKSRKLLFSVFSVLVIFIGAVLAAKLPQIQAVYSSMVTGVLGVVGAYLTGNIATKLVGVKAMTPADDEASKMGQKVGEKMLQVAKAVIPSKPQPPGQDPG